MSLNKRICYNAHGVDVVESAADFKCDKFEFESLQACYLTNAAYTGGAQYMNVRRSVHWWQIFCVQHVFKIDQSQMTKSHVFNTLLKLICHKCSMAKYIRWLKFC